MLFLLLNFINPLNQFSLGLLYINLNGDYNLSFRGDFNLDYIVKEISFNDYFIYKRYNELEEMENKFKALHTLGEDWAGGLYIDYYKKELDVGLGFQYRKDFLNYDCGFLSYWKEEGMIWRNRLWIKYGVFVLEEKFDWQGYITISNTIIKLNLNVKKHLGVGIIGEYEHDFKENVDRIETYFQIIWTK